jgi:hypothetical protein
MLGLTLLQGKHYGTVISLDYFQSSLKHIALHAKVQVLVSLHDQNYVWSLPPIFLFQPPW